jgi:hypothetical protein
MLLPLWYENLGKHQLEDPFPCTFAFAGLRADTVHKQSKVLSNRYGISLQLHEMNPDKALTAIGFAQRRLDA